MPSLRVLYILGFLLAGFAAAHAQTTYTVGWQPSAIAVGYLNSDGNPDLVVANQLDNTVSVLLGNGSGGFTVTGPYPTGNEPGNPSCPSIAIADFNSDGNADVIVWTSAGIQILFGDGTGKLGPPQTVYSPYSSAARFAIADLRQTGKMDLVVGTYDGVDVLMGDGDGTFASPLHYVITSAPPVGGQFTLADVNGDGYPDILAFNIPAPSSPGISSFVLLNDGKGNFGSPIVTPWNGSCVIGSDALLGDFNSDGKVDVIGMAATGAGLCLALGNGRGRFAAPQLFPSSLPAVSIATDYNGDGKLDVIGGDYIALGIGLPGFGAPIQLTSPGTFYYVLAADLNHDGKPDLVGYTGINNQIAVFINNYNGQTVATSVSAEAVPNAAAPGQPLTLSANVTSIAGAPNVGSVHFVAGSTDLGTVNVNLGVASESVSFPAAGLYQITANYSGATDAKSNITYTASAAAAINITIVVNSAPASTTTTLSASPLTANVGGTVTLQASIAAGGTLANSGTVEFSDGAANLGSAPVNSQGVATLSIASLSAGTHAITAAFNGGGAYQSSTSSSISVSIVAADFSVSIFGAASATVKAGAPATFQLAVSPAGGFNSTVSFTCSGLPAGAACNFSPATVAPNGGNYATTTLTVSTSATSAALANPAPGRRPRENAERALKSLAAAGLFAVVVLGAGMRRGAVKILVCLVLSVAAMQLVSCGGGAPHDNGAGTSGGSTTTGGSTTGTSGSSTGSSGSSAGNAATATPAGTSQVSVTATSGGLSHSTLLSLTVAQ